MSKLLKTVVTAYIVIKVAPVIIKGVSYITEGAVKGVVSKVVKDVFKAIDVKEKESRHLRLSHNYPWKYDGYRLKSKEKA